MQLLQEKMRAWHDHVKALPTHQQLMITAATALSTGVGLTLMMTKAYRSRDGDLGAAGKSVYDTEESARQYMEFHYTPSRDSYTQKLRAISEAYDFPSRVALKFRQFLNPAGSPPLRGPGSPKTRALDVGCATGASVFEMSKIFDEVIGIDQSEIFIHLALEVKNSNKVTYTAPVQGMNSEPRQLALPKTVHTNRCQFYAGDAMNMIASSPVDPEKRRASRTYPEVMYWQASPGETFDAVLCLNLVDRVPDPEKLLRTFVLLLKPGGLLILADPYSWQVSTTSKGKWLGGVDGVHSEDEVKRILSENFTQVSESDEAFIIRTHVRHYQLGFSHCLVMRRK